MVNRWLPEPPTDGPFDEVQPSDDLVIIGSDTSDAEDEEMQYEGYQLLPPDPVDADNQSDEEDNESELQSEDVTPSSSALPSIESVDRCIIREVWSESTPRSADIEMDSVKANEVKMAMANFTLPSTSFPDWAHSIPEEQWKEQLINKIHSLQEPNDKK